MSLSSIEFEHSAANPLDLIEQLASANDWSFDRHCDEEMAAEAPGRWCDYNLYFAWRKDVEALHFTCAFDMRVPLNKRAAVHELIVLANERMWLGHFGMWTEEGMPMFRHALLIRGVEENRALETLEDLVDVAITECERFYPAFQYVVWGGKSATEAIAASMLDPVGEA
jgi:hypothetical protein